MIVSLLFLTLLLGSIFIYVVSGKNLLSPIFILFGVFTFSTFAIVINLDFFGLDISFITYLVIILSLIFWGVGDLAASYFYSKYKKPQPSFIIEYRILPSNALLVISLLLVGLISFEEYIRFVKIGDALGGTNFITYYGLIRNYVVEVQNFQRTDNLYPVTGLIAFFITMARNISYVFIAIFVFNMVYCGVKKYKYLLPAIAYLPILLFSSSRSTFLEFFSWILILSVLMRYQANGWGVGNKKVFKVMLIPSIILLLGFYSLGFVRSAGVGTMFTSEMFNSLSKYIGSSIFGLDYLLNGHIPKGGDFAQHTSPLLYTILEKFGYKASHIPLHGEFFYWKNDGANIYTALRNPIIDYTVLGMLGTRIILGFLYGMLIRHFIYNHNNPYNILEYVLLPMFYFPLMYYFITDLFYYFFNLDFIYTLFFLSVLNVLIIKKSKVLIPEIA
jgi:oligosaccharide repeat unit polymerase